MIATFKQFLLNEDAISKFKYDPLETTKEVAAAIKKHCGQAWTAYQAGPRIFRGWKGEREMGIYDPKSGQRTSKNTTNHYTALLDTNPKNHGWPARANSFICTTQRGTAAGYGTPYHIFVFDDTEIGETNTDDIWHLRLYFPGLNFQVSIVDFNKFWDRIDAPETNMKDMIQHVKQAGPKLILTELEKRNYAPPAGMSAEEVVELLISDIPKAYSFSGLECTLNKIESLGKGEVWFSGKCIMVPVDKMTEIWAAMKGLE